MGKQTVFPMIEVESVEVRTVDKQSGITDLVEMTTDIDSVEDAVKNLLNKDIIGEDELLIYSLNVTALTESSANLKGKAYVRAKNPTEPRRLAHVVTVVADSDPGGVPGFKEYSVNIGVLKDGVFESPRFFREE